MCRNHVDDTVIYRLIELIEKYKYERQFSDSEQFEYRKLIDKVKKENRSILDNLFQINI